MTDQDKDGHVSQKEYEDLRTATMEVLGMDEDDYQTIKEKASGMSVFRELAAKYPRGNGFDKEQFKAVVAFRVYQEIEQHSVPFDENKDFFWTEKELNAALVELEKEAECMKEHIPKITSFFDMHKDEISALWDLAAENGLTKSESVGVTSQILKIVLEHLTEDHDHA